MEFSPPDGNAPSDASGNSASTSVRRRDNDNDRFSFRSSNGGGGSGQEKNVGGFEFKHHQSVSRRLDLLRMTPASVGKTTPIMSPSKTMTVSTGERVKQEALDLAKAEWSENRRLMRNVVDQHHEDMARAESHLKSVADALEKERTQTASLSRQLLAASSQAKEAEEKARAAAIGKRRVEDTLAKASAARIAAAETVCKAAVSEKEMTAAENRALRKKLDEKEKEMKAMSEAVADVNNDRRRRTSSAHLAQLEELLQLARETGKGTPPSTPGGPARSVEDILRAQRDEYKRMNESNERRVLKLAKLLERSLKWAEGERATNHAAADADSSQRRLLARALEAEKARSVQLESAVRAAARGSNLSVSAPSTNGDTQRLRMLRKTVQEKDIAIKYLREELIKLKFAEHRPGNNQASVVQARERELLDVNSIEGAPDGSFISAASGTVKPWFAPMRAGGAGALTAKLYQLSNEW